MDTGCQLNAGHDHHDTNGFYIYRAGRWLAPESEGTGKYDTAWHNTLLIDSQGQYYPLNYNNPEDFRGSDGFLEATANTLSFDYVAADATRRYKHIPGLEDITRQVVFIRPNYFVMLDNLAAATAHQYAWISHFGKSVSIEGKWIRGNAGGGQILGVGVAAPQSFKITAGNDGQPYVRVRPASSEADVRLIHILYPTDKASWKTKPGVTTLADTGKAAAVRVQMKDGSGRIDDILLTYVQPLATLVVGPYKYDGQVAVVSQGVDEDLKKLFIYGGTFLTNQATGKVLVTHLDRSEPFEACYSNQTVAVYGTIHTSFTLYAPQAEQLYINGQIQPFTRSGDYLIFDNSELKMPTSVSTVTPTNTPNTTLTPNSCITTIYLPLIVKQRAR